MNISLYVSSENEQTVKKIMDSMVSKTPELKRYLKTTGIIRDAFETGLGVLVARHIDAATPDLPGVVSNGVPLASPSVASARVDGCGEAAQGAGVKGKKGRQSSIADTQQT